MLRIEVKNRPLRVTSVELLKTCISEGFGGVYLLNFRRGVCSPCLNFIKFKVMERQFYTPRSHRRQAYNFHFLCEESLGFNSEALFI